MTAEARWAVLLGGAVGTAARILLAAASGLGPWATLAVNVTGAFALGLLLRSTDDELLRAGLGTGLLGGWTTFSAFALDTSLLLATAPALAGVYVGVSVLGGAGAALLGRRGLAS